MCEAQVELTTAIGVWRHQVDPGHRLQTLNLLRALGLQFQVVAAKDHGRQKYKTKYFALKVKYKDLLKDHMKFRSEAGINNSLVDF